MTARGAGWRHKAVEPAMNVPGSIHRWVSMRMAAGLMPAAPRSLDATNHDDHGNGLCRPLPGPPTPYSG